MNYTGSSCTPSTFWHDIALGKVTRPNESSEDVDCFETSWGSLEDKAYRADGDPCHSSLATAADVAASGSRKDALERYAAEHGFDLAWLAKEFRLHGDQHEMLIPYFDCRDSKTGFQSWGGTSQKWKMKEDDFKVYGAWRVPAFRGPSLVVCVGGEEHVHAAAANGVEAVGVSSLQDEANNLIRTADSNRKITELLLLLPSAGVTPFTYRCLLNFLQFVANEGGMLSRILEVTPAKVIGVEGLADLHRAGTRDSCFRERLELLRQHATPVVKPCVDDPGEDHLMCNEVGNAARFALQHGKKVKYVPEWKKWIRYDGQRWKICGDHEIHDLAISTVRSLMSGHLLPSNSKKHIEWAENSMSRTRLDNTITLARSRRGMTVSAELLDQDVMLFNVSNGTIDLRTGQLREHKPEDLITKITDVAYDPSARCDFWMSSLDLFTGLWRAGLSVAEVQSCREVQEFLARVVGYSLTGKTHLKGMVFLYGSADSGKSTFASLMEKLCGSYARRTNIKTLMASWNTSVNTPDVADLAGARMVVASETQEGSRWDEARVKDLTGAVDRINTCRKYENPFSFTPQFTIWIYGNHRPTVRGGDQAFWNRFWVVPFDYSIPQEMRIGSDEVSRRLDSEMPGILAWAIRGWLDCQANGLRPPEAVKNAVTQYQERADVLAQFLSDCCFTQADCMKGTLVFGAPNPSQCELVVSHKDLYGAYIAWASEANIDPCDLLAFKEKMKTKGYQNSAYHPNRLTYWAGVTLREGIRYRDRNTGESVSCRPLGYHPPTRQQVPVIIK